MIARIDALLNWLDPTRGRIQFEPAPGAGRFDIAVVAMCVPFALFTALVITAPLALPEGSVTDLSGGVGTIENRAVTDAMPAPWSWLYALGDAACHQKPERSFFLGGNEMPFCARDLAIFAGIAGALAACAPARSRGYRAAVLMPWWGFFALLAPIAIDGGAQAVFGWESDNLRRAITGTLAGVAVAFALVFIVYEGRFAWERSRRDRAQRRAQGDAVGRASGATGSVGSKEVESAPTE